MAKGPNLPPRLTFIDIVMRADAETIRAAYEARLRIDELLVAREEAYRRIVEVEDQVEQIVGEPGVFVFPPPPLPVAGLASPVPAVRRSLKPSAPTAAAAPTGGGDEPAAPAEAAEPAQPGEAAAPDEADAEPAPEHQPGTASHAGRLPAKAKRAKHDGHGRDAADDTAEKV